MRSIRFEAHLHRLSGLGGWRTLMAQNEPDATCPDVDVALEPKHLDALHYGWEHGSAWTCGGAIHQMEVLRSQAQSDFAPGSVFSLAACIAAKWKHQAWG